MQFERRRGDKDKKIKDRRLEVRQFLVCLVKTALQKELGRKSVAILAQACVLSINLVPGHCSWELFASAFQMVCRGWTQMDVPSGWIQVLRCPRSQAERWPNAKPPIQGGRREQSQAPGRWRQERVRINPFWGRMRRGRLLVWKPRLQPWLKAKRSAEELQSVHSWREHRSLSRKLRSVCTRCTTQSVGERIGRGRGQSATIASSYGGTSTGSPTPSRVGCPSDEFFFWTQKKKKHRPRIVRQDISKEPVAAERDALAEQVKHQTALKLVERVHPMQSSVDAEQLVLDRASKRRAVGEKIPSGQQDLPAARTLNCARLGSRVVVWNPNGFGAAGASHDSPRTPNVHIWAHRRFQHHQNSTKKDQKRGEKE